LQYTAANTPNYLVQRDASGDFIANVVTAVGGIAGGTF
jgi:hypothetical protein